MGRRGHIWPRGERGWFCTLNGRQIPLGKDKVAAEKLYHSLKATSERPTPNRATTRALVKTYLDKIDGTLAPNTLTIYRSELNDWSHCYGSVLASELRPYHIDDWVDAHPSWGQSTRRARIVIVKTWSAWCAAKGYLDVDRLRAAKGPKTIPRKPAPPDVLASFESQIEDDSFRDLYIFLYDTGCRPIEAVTLSADKVDLKNRSAIVHGKPATKSRTIGLTNRVVAMLKRLAKANPTGPILRTKRGAAWRPGYIVRYFHYWEARAKLPIHITAYHLRHDLARRWSSAGIDSIVIAKQLGHSRKGEPHVDLLISTYFHPAAASLASAAQAGAPHAAAARVDQTQPKAAARAKRENRSRGSGVGRGRAK